MRTSSTGSGQVTPVSKTDRRSSNVSSNASQTLLESSKGSPGGEGVLQTFFNSLLNRKSSGSAAGVPAGTSSQRSLSNASADSLRSRDVHAELDRIIEGSSGNKSSSISNSSVNSPPTNE